MSNKKVSEAAEVQLVGGLTPDEIAALKKQHGEIILISLPDDDRHFFFKKPSMQTMSAVAKAASKDPVQASMVYFTNCLVHGDEKAVHDVDVFANISPYLEDLIATKRVEVKNL